MEEYKVQIESWGPFAEGRNNMFQTAIKNHEELFPNHTSALKATDPELIEIFDNFAFDEVLSYGNLDKKTRLMVILAALIAMQTLNEYKIMLGRALNIGVTPVEAKEIVYQAESHCPQNIVIREELKNVRAAFE